MMKRAILFFILALTCAAAVCQKPSLNKAYNYYVESNFDKAKTAIDLCTADPKLSAKASTWLYAANIDFYLANQEYGKRQQETTYQVTAPNAPVEAFDAFVKARELNKNVEATDMLSPDDGLPKLYPLLLIQGVDLLMAKDYAQANTVLNKAVQSYEMQTPPEYPLDGELYYYYAYSFEMLHNTTMAVRYYEAALADHSQNVNVYLRLIENSQEDAAKTARLFAAAKEKFPDNVEIMVLEANRHIADKNYEEAEKLLRKAYAREANNLVTVYNLGLCCYYIAQDKFEKANTSAVAGNKTESDNVSMEANRYFDEAERYFEKYLQSQPDDVTVMNVLKTIYARKQSPKYDEIVKKIEQLGK